MGKMPRSQLDWNPGLSTGRDGRDDALWKDKVTSEGRTIVISTAYLLSLLPMCTMLSVDGTFSVMSV